MGYKPLSWGGTVGKLVRKSCRTRPSTARPVWWAADRHTGSGQRARQALAEPLKPCKPNRQRDGGACEGGSLEQLRASASVVHNVPRDAPPERVLGTAKARGNSPGPRRVCATA